MTSVGWEIEGSKQGARGQGYGGKGGFRHEGRKVREM